MVKKSGITNINFAKEIQEVDISTLSFADYNPRTLTKEEGAHLRESLTQFGFVDPIIVNQHPDRPNVIIGGHMRTRVWQEMGGKTVPVVFVSLPLEAEREFNIRLNRNSGEWNWEMLANNFDKDDLLKWGFTEEELVGGLEIESFGSSVGENTIPDAAQPISVLGDIYELGAHRLVCGDSCQIDDVEKLMGEERADIIWTDPPWNVNYGADDNDGHYRADRTILNDKKSAPDWEHFCDDFAGQLFLASKPGAMIYLVMSAQEWPTVDRALRENHFHWSSTIIWAKDRLVLSRKDYHTRYEPIWYGWNGEAPRLFPLKDRKQDDVWEIARPSVSELHPTTKPIELIEKSLLNSSAPGSIVLDLFLGSGSTLIAAEKTGRRCYGCELDPHYIDVEVKRWIEFMINNGKEDDISVIRNGKKMDHKEFLK